MRRELSVHRLSWDAYEQGVTVEDLARLLITSERTISHILATYSKQGVFIPTRGRVRDIGPGVSHKS
jgi:DNA-binding transcriptional regulator LsrR (DeoR family)